ncbi:MAG: tetratricopeptide repeat protein [Bacteroidales bacterium]
MDNKHDILVKAEQFVEEEKFDDAIELLNTFLANNSEDMDILLKKAFLLKQMQKFSDALNTLKKVFDNDPENAEALKLHTMIMDILRFQQTDIYASTNLSNDPWLDE